MLNTEELILGTLLEKNLKEYSRMSDFKYKNNRV